MTTQSQIEAAKCEFLAEWLGWKRVGNEWDDSHKIDDCFFHPRYLSQLETGNGLMEILTHMRGESEEVRKRFNSELSKCIGWSVGWPYFDELTPTLVRDCACLALGYES